MTHPVRVGAPRAERAGGTSRVVADVDGQPLWFESDDLRLAPRPEAFASAVLPGTLESRRVLDSARPLPRRWCRGAVEIAGIGGGWWGWAPAEVVARRRRELPRAVRRLVPGGRTALAFSGGADSFHALLRSGFRVDLLVSVHGFDIPLADASRMAAWERSFREIARSLGVASAVVRTNVRDHPTATLSSWPRAHGGALAALGHVLGGRVDRLLIASSYPRWLEAPWGSTGRLDPLWSSERLEIVHVGDDHWRADKLREIGDHPLVRRHLRVCWENRTAALNCGRCEKCVRTQLVLLGEQLLDGFTVFPPGPALPELVDAVERLDSEGLAKVYRDLAEHLPAPAREAVLRLVERSFPVGSAR